MSLSTFVLFASTLFVFIVSRALWAGALLLGLRWIKLERRSFTKAFGISCVYWGVALLLAFATALVGAKTLPAILATMIAECAIAIVVCWAMIHKLFGTTWLRSAQAWLPTFAVTAFSTAT